ncbi:Peroxidase 70 [Linum perenne]
MASRTMFFMFLLLAVNLASAAASSSGLSPYYYYNGCDGSILLDATPTIDSEKTALANNNSARGFEVIDQIKAEVDKVCGRPLGGPSWEVQLGRRDSTTASRTTANNDIPSPFLDLPALRSSFRKQGLNDRDLVVLSGGHTIGFAQCQFFRNRIFNDTAATINPNFAAGRRETCFANSGDTNLASLDSSPARFDVSYFKNLAAKKGLLHSDQEILAAGPTGDLVNAYGEDGRKFWFDFGRSMVKMGNIKVLTGKRGQIRVNCRRVN